jgi:hypothetical protein
MMTWLRKSLGWFFIIQGLGLLPVLPVAIYMLVQHPDRFSHRNPMYLIVVASVVSLLGALYAAASWAIRTDAKFVRGLAIAASSVNILLSIPLFVALLLPSASPRIHTPLLVWIFPVSGLLGLFAFALQYAPAYPANVRLQSIAGDGTNFLLNKSFGFLYLVIGVAGYIWWGRWTHTHGVARNHGLLLDLQISVVLLIVTLLHETGHAYTGWALGMRIRAFIVGPFQFRIQQGRWGFKFDIKKLWSGGGATGVVPTDPRQPISNEVWMIAAGPLVNLATGLMALCVASLEEPDSPAQFHGLMALFAMYSFLAFAMNLVPVRTKESYSDGAQLYQLLAGGPFADLHRANALVGSSLVTGLRPKDYDMELIERAATGAAQGVRLLLMRLHAYNHFLDHGRIAEALNAMSEAEAVYSEYAELVPGGILPTFIFGNAFVRQDAVAARTWWERMQAKKSVPVDSDYWLACSALNFAEGNLIAADEAWSRGNELAQKLPKAGAYEFARHQFAQLRKAISETGEERRQAAYFVQDAPATAV